MSEKRAKGCLVAALVWCVLLAILGLSYRFLVHPHLRGRLTKATSGTSQYRAELTLSADSFSGYSIFRSDALKEELRLRQIKLTVRDDQADYDRRVASLKSGESPLAVFTIDSLITAGAKAGDFPGTIVWVIDETKGGDAVVAYQSALPSIQDLNHPSARFVLTPRSPSEFLARVVLAHFNLPKLGGDWLVPTEGAGAVLKAFRGAGPTEKKAFVMWEPYVSQALQQKGAHVLLDSGRLKGYIVDVLVAERRFLADNAELVREFIEAYTRAAFRYAQEPQGMANLIMADARQTGAPSVDAAQAAKIVQGIQWKNLLENYAHFGLVGVAERGGLPTVEDMIGNITDVLVKTKALPQDPLGGKYYTLYFDRLVADLKAAGFHPGKGMALIPGLDSASASNEAVRGDERLRSLRPEEWERLVAVGELRTAPIAFKRGSAEVSLDGERDLIDLAKRLQTFPLFYVRVTGHARAEGDPEANRVLARARAEAVARVLTAQGVLSERLHVETAPLAAAAAEAQAVSFFVGQIPY
jgi:outer membrane protein OmpA-like peptidoglycan-associated protein/ABC-type nitrate/sulfonate/bicarbonate transport system substrate-binding protein